MTDQRTRDEKIQAALEGPTSHVFDDYDNSPQGQKAIALGIKNRQGAAYDWAKAPAADFSWPEIDADEIGQLEPWLCYAKEGGWADLNAIADGDARRATAAYRTLGTVEGETFKRVDDEAFATIEKFLSLPDAQLAPLAAQAGLRKDARFSYRDYLLGMKLDFERILHKSNERAQAALNAATEHDQQEMRQHVAAAKSGGLLDPVQGVSLEDWAAANAKLMSGESIDTVLRVLKIEKPAWDTISGEWNGRMSRDTTFAITTVYGNAFTNSNIGRFAKTGQAAGAARPPAGGALDKAMKDFELYVKIMTHQNVAAGQGLDAATVLGKYGLSVMDWSMLGAHWGPKMTTDMTLAMKMGGLMARFTAELSQPGAGDDITF